MTEPTHEIRHDVAALLDIALSDIMLRVGIDDLEAARETIRQRLSAAWHEGWMAGFDNGHDLSATTANPYTRLGK